MDTRSVIRSRRQSARLHKQPRDDKTAKHGQSIPNRRVSDTALSRQRSATPKPTTSKTSTTKRAQSTTETAHNGTSEAIIAADSSVKKGKRVASSPMFPNLPPTSDTRPGANINDLTSGTVFGTKTSAAATDDIGTEGRGHTGGRWIKTAQGAMRLVYDTPQDASIGAIGRSGATSVDEAPSIPENRRRSARLAGSTPEVEEIKPPVTIAGPETTQPSTTTEKAVIAPMTPLKQGPTAESRRPLRRVSSGTSSDSSLTDLEELPSQSNLFLADDQTAEFYLAEKTSPIPELVADIARIIETSSPIAARASQTNISNIATMTKRPAAETIATRASAPESTGIANSPTEAVDNTHSSSFSQEMVAHPLPLEFTSEGTTLGQDIPTGFEKDASLSAAALPDTFSEIQDQTDGSRGVKRRAEHMSRDEKTLPTHHQSLTTYNRPLQFSTPTKRVNLIDSAASRDCYDIEDDELGSPGAGLWLDGQAGEAGRASALQEEPQRHDTIKCGDCGKALQKFIVCARCLKTGYCGKYCQMWNWPIHRQVCVASEEADSGEVKRQEEYLEGAWAGALQVLKKNVVDRDNEKGTEVQDQTEMQAIVHCSFMDHGVGEGIMEHGSGSLGGDDGEAVTGEKEIRQQGCGMGEDDNMGVSVRTDKHAGDNVQEKEDIVFKMPPPTPESMFRSRAMALRLAQAAEV